MTIAQVSLGGVDPWGVLPSKLHPPRLRPDALHRTGVVQLLLATSAPCVVVRAGAGCGKTTAVRQWIEEDFRPTAWVNIDEGDNDPVVLLRHVVRALHELEPLPAVEAAIMTRSPQVEGAVLPALATALGGERAPFVLVLDDVHLLTRDRSVLVLTQLIDAIPDGSQIVLCGRAVPQVHFARRLVAGTAAEVTHRDLAFSDDEAMAVLGRSLPELDPETARLVVKQSEGWPAGIHLSVLALDRHPDPQRMVATFGGSDRRLADYLHDELLHYLPAEVRGFLVRTSILDRVSGPLCDAILGEQGSGDVLERLAASTNLFVVAFEDEPNWFRYHHLFAELLRAELRRTAPGDEPELHRRAATWLAREGFADAAVHHARLTGDDAFAAEIVYRQVIPVLTHGMMASLQRWLDGFPAATIQRHVLLALSAGWLDLTQGRPGTDHWLAIAESVRDDGPLPDGTVSLEVAVSALRMTSGLGGVKQTAESARTVKEAGPDGSPWWGLAWLIEANARQALGDLDDPVAAYEEAEVGSRGFPPAHVAAVAQLALACLRQDDGERGQALAREAAAELREQRLEGYGMLMMVHAAEAYAAARRGSLADASAAIVRAEALRASMGEVVPRSAVQFRLLLAEAEWLLGQHTAARHQLDQAVELLPVEPDALEFHRWARALGEHLESSASRESNLVAFGITTAELRVLEQLTTHRSFEEIGKQLYISRNTVKTHAISIYRRLGVSGRGAAVEKAIQTGLIDA